MIKCRISHINGTTEYIFLTLTKQSHIYRFFRIIPNYVVNITMIHYCIQKTLQTILMTFKKNS